MDLTGVLPKEDYGKKNSNWFQYLVLAIVGAHNENERDGLQAIVTYMYILNPPISVTAGPSRLQPAI